MSPEPVPILVPSAIHGEAKLGEQIIKQELPVPLKISQLCAMRVRLITFRLCLRKGHSLSGLAGDTNGVEMYGMVKFVFLCNHNNGISRNLLVNRNVNTDKKTYKE